MVPEKQRLLVDIAAEVMADERQNILASAIWGSCLTSLPHKRLPDDQAWQKHGHKVTLLVEPGRLKTTRGEIELYGVLCGARARMILLYLQTQAVRTNSPQVALGRSMRNWMERDGTSRWRRDQLEALQRAVGPNLRLHSEVFLEEDDEDNARGFKRGAMVNSGLQFAVGDGAQGTLLGRPGDPRSCLLQSTYAIIPCRSRRRPFVSFGTGRCPLTYMSGWHGDCTLSPSSHRFPGPPFIPSSGPASISSFNSKPRFTEALAAAVAAYPEARVEIDKKRVILHPSRPPIARLTRPALLAGWTGFIA